MTEAELMDVAREGIWTMIKVTTPVLMTALVVGLLISILQAVVQLQEQTLTFVPKVLAVFGALMLFLPFMISTLGDFWRSVLDRMVAGGG
ncbi:MAG: flagellar biosynthesis protein FliQ [Magnetospirillum sp.]|nr:flagellar biosynthesis protein FliQ [Magnetospirillum sp.]